MTEEQPENVDAAIDRCMVAIVDSFHDMWGADVDEATKRTRLDGFLAGRLTFRVRRGGERGIEVVTDIEAG